MTHKVSAPSSMGRCERPRHAREEKQAEAQPLNSGGPRITLRVIHPCLQVAGEINRAPGAHWMLSQACGAPARGQCPRPSTRPPGLLRWAQDVAQPRLEFQPQVWEGGTRRGHLRLGLPQCPPRTAQKAVKWLRPPRPTELSHYHF